MASRRGDPDSHLLAGPASLFSTETTRISSSSSFFPRVTAGDGPGLFLENQGLGLALGEDGVEESRGRGQREGGGAGWDPGLG